MIELIYIIFISVMVIPVTYYVLEIMFSKTIYEKSQKNVDMKNKDNLSNDREKKIY